MALAVIDFPPHCDELEILGISAVRKIAGTGIRPRVREGMACSTKDTLVYQYPGLALQALFGWKGEYMSIHPRLADRSTQDIERDEEPLAG